MCKVQLIPQTFGRLRIVELTIEHCHCSTGMRRGGGRGSTISTVASAVTTIGVEVAVVEEREE